jgi:hypothetical protein
VLGTISQAIWIIKSKVKMIEQSWDNYNYNITNLEGAYGTLSFTKTEVVGVFFDKNSYLNPLKKNTKYSLQDQLKDIPAHLVGLAKEECLQYMLREYEEVDQPIITASLWSDHFKLFINSKWVNWLNNGGRVIEKQLQNNFEESLKNWTKYYSFDEKCIKVVREIFSLKPNPFENEITLPARLSKVIENMNNVGDGIDLCKHQLKSINVVF